MHSSQPLHASTSIVTVPRALISCSGAHAGTASLPRRRRVVGSTRSNPARSAASFAAMCCVRYDGIDCAHPLDGRVEADQARDRRVRADHHHRRAQLVAELGRDLGGRHPNDLVRGRRASVSKVASFTSTSPPARTLRSIGAQYCRASRSPTRCATPAAETATDRRRRRRSRRCSCRASHRRRRRRAARGDPRRSRPRASTCAASCTPWPPIPVSSTSRSMPQPHPLQRELDQVLDVGLRRAPPRHERVVHGARSPGGRSRPHRAADRRPPPPPRRAAARPRARADRASSSGNRSPSRAPLIANGRVFSAASALRACSSTPSIQRRTRGAPGSTAASRCSRYDTSRRCPSSSRRGAARPCRRSGGRRPGSTGRPRARCRRRGGRSSRCGASPRSRRRPAAAPRRRTPPSGRRASGTPPARPPPRGEQRSAHPERYSSRRRRASPRARELRSAARGLAAAHAPRRARPALRGRRVVDGRDPRPDPGEGARGATRPPAHGAVAVPPVPRHVRRRRRPRPPGRRRPAGARCRAGRPRRVPAAELARGRGHVLGGRHARRGPGPDRPLLRPEGGRLHPPPVGRADPRHRGLVRPPRLPRQPRDAAPGPARPRARGRRRRTPRPASPTSRSTPSPRATGSTCRRRSTRRRPRSSPTRRARPPTRRASCTRTARSASRSASSARCRPTDRRPTLVGAPVGHGIGMLAALLLPVWRNDPIHLIDVWDPGVVLAGDARRRAPQRDRRHLLPHEPARPPRLHRRAPRAHVAHRARRLRRSRRR